MALIIRRMLLLVSLIFWQGGFMFYGGVVVPVSTRILGSGTEQGFITQPVTNYLNILGAICLMIWLEHLWHERRAGVLPLEWYAWAFAAISLVILIGIHPRMDSLLNPETTTVLDRAAFRVYHKIYIGTSSLQWADSLLMLFLLMLRWRHQDSTGSGATVES